MKVDELFEGEVIHAKFGRDREEEEKKDIQIFQALENKNIKFLEKPAYWEELEKNEDGYKKLSIVTFDEIKKSLKKSGIEIPTFEFKEFYHGVGDKDLPKSPQTKVKVNLKAKPVFFVLANEKGTYLCRTLGASSYIRCWIRLY